MRKAFWTLLAAFGLITACATPRSNSIFSLSFSDQPPRAAIRGQCNGQQFTTQGTVVCEQKAPSQAVVSVKVPPLEGRVIYSNGQLKSTEDFNWYPKQGFWIWKKKPLKDTWVDLDLGEIAATYGDWPVALDIAATDPDKGVIVTRGMLYYRVCNDQDVPCSKLEVGFNCSGWTKTTGPNEIGKCERLSGSPQAFVINTKGKLYNAKSGAKLYVSAPRMGVVTSYDVSAQDIASGQKKIELPKVPSGPTLVGIRMAWWEGDKLVQVETRILIIGFSPEWTGLDQPHYMTNDQTIDWVKPVMSDLMEIDTFKGRNLVSKVFGSGKLQTVDRPEAGTRVCAFSWQRDSSDLTVQCLDETLKEVSFP